MKILFDQGTPVPLRGFLTGHQVDTAYERGWQMLENGELLTAAETSGYDILLTTDQNLRYQQNLGARSISIIVLSSTSWPRIMKATAQIVAAIERRPRAHITRSLSDDAVDRVNVVASTFMAPSGRPWRPTLLLPGRRRRGQEVQPDALVPSSGRDDVSGGRSDKKA